MYLRTPHYWLTGVTDSEKICILSRMSSIYASVNARSSIKTKLETIHESRWETTITQQRTEDLFRCLYDLTALRSRIDKDSTPEEKSGYAAKDNKIVRLTEQFFFTEGGSPDSDNEGVSLLQFAIIFGCVPLARLLVSKGANVNYGPVDRGEWSDGLPSTMPLILAVDSLCARADIVELLMQNGADIDVTEYGRNLEQTMARGTMSWIAGDKEQFEKILAMIRAERVRRTNQPKREAFAMALHERLGANSWVQALDPGVVRLIIDSV
jgi:hypothetical protein